MVVEMQRLFRQPRLFARASCRLPTVRGFAGPAAAPSLGVIRLDYDYPPAPGDIDCPDSFPYDVYYRAVPGFTFEACQKNDISPKVQQNLKEAVEWLVKEKGVSGITGDCGFMMYFQPAIREMAKKPVFMSSLAQLPAVTCAYGKHEKIAIFTANGKNLEPMRDLIKKECGVDTSEHRYIIVGCENVPGFGAVARGDKVDTEKVTPGIVTKALEVMKEHPDLRAIMMECTELPPYSNAVRAATGLPVFDAITSCNMFMAGRFCNVNFGEQGWQQQWDHVQEKYVFGENLSVEEKAELVNKAAA